MLIDLREIMCNFSPGYLVLLEVKQEESFPSAQSSILDYEIRARLDRDKNSSIEFVVTEE